MQEYPIEVTAAVLEPNTFSRDGYTFTGWNTKQDGSGVSYAAGDTFTLEDHIVLYAQWEAAVHTLSGKIVGHKKVTYVSVNAYLQSRF